MGKSREIESKSENHKQSVSVAGILTHRGKLLLVQDNQLEWGLPAGRTKQLEVPEQVFRRELSEETGLDPELVIWDTGTYGSTPSVGWVVKEDKTSLGVIYRAGYIGEIPEGEWKIKKKGEEIIIAKLFDTAEVLQLVEDGSKFRKRKFNEGQIIKWLIDSFNARSHSLLALEDTAKADKKEVEIVEALRKWILEKYEDGFFSTKRDPLLYHFLVYTPPYTIVDQGTMVSISLQELMEGHIQIGRLSEINSRRYA